MIDDADKKLCNQHGSVCTRMDTVEKNIDKNEENLAEELKQLQNVLNEKVDVKSFMWTIGGLTAIFGFILILMGNAIFSDIKSLTAESKLFMSTITDKLEKRDIILDQRFYTLSEKVLTLFNDIQREQQMARILLENHLRTTTHQYDDMAEQPLRKENSK